MAKLLESPPKFVHTEWIIGNKHLYANSEAERAAAERLILDSCRTIDDTTKITKHVVFDSQKRLDQKIHQTKHWENELNIKLDEIKDEISALVEMRKRIDKSIEALREHLHISQQCLHNRQKRLLNDLVHDNAEMELLKEVEVLQGAIALLVRTKEQAIEQIRLNRKAKYDIDCDLSNKFQARGIDNYNTGLHPGSKCIEYHPGSAKVSGKSVTIEEWIDFTERNVTSGEKQRQNSSNLRQIADGILQSTYNDLLRQKDCTDRALAYRIYETRDAKDKLQEHLKLTQREIIEMEDNIHNLKHALDNPISKLDSLKMTETRLENRMHRPGNELCRDLAQYALIDTHHELREAIAEIDNRIAQSHESLKALDRQKLQLEQQIEIKSLSLFIDETECQAMRQSISVECY